MQAIALGAGMADEADPTSLFSDRVLHYVKGRPDYPPAVLDCLREECGLTPEDIVADVGSGTGKLAELFLKHGNRVFGVEPNREMREAAEALLSRYPDFVSVEGSAEATTLPDASVDWVTAGQAFHWFGAEQARTEFQRILRPGGWVMLVWNGHDFQGSPFMTAYERLVAGYAANYGPLGREKADEGIAQFFRGPVETREFDNVQHLDFDGLTARHLSSSCIPLPGQPRHEDMMRDLRDLFDACQEGGRVRFLYVTRMYFGSLG